MGVGGIHVVDLQADVDVAGVGGARVVRRIVAVEVPEQLELDAPGQVDPARLDVDAGVADHGAELRPLEDPAVAGRRVEQGGPERDRPVHVGHRDADVVDGLEPAHATSLSASSSTATPAMAMASLITSGGVMRRTAPGAGHEHAPPRHGRHQPPGDVGA